MTLEDLGRVRSEIDLGLPFDFAAKQPGSSQLGNPKINDVRMKGGQIVMDLSSEGGDLRANVVIDENTLKLISATLVK
jgi:hypothetical protein